MKWLTGLAAGLALSAGTVHAADKWDMLTAENAGAIIPH